MQHLGRVLIVGRPTADDLEHFIDLQRPGMNPLLDQALSVSIDPFVGARQIEKFLIGQLPHVDRLMLRRAIDHLVDAATGLVGDLIIMAFAGIAPIGDIDAAIGTIVDSQAAKPGIIGEEKVLLVAGDRSGPAVGDAIVVNAVAVQVAGEEAVAVGLGEVDAEVDHAADVSVPAAGVGVFAVAAAGRGPRTAGPVNMIDAAIHPFVEMRVEVVAIHTLIVAAGNDMKGVVDDAVGDEQFAGLVEVDAPGVGGSMRDHLVLLGDRMIPPNAAVDRRPILDVRPRLADF